MSEPPRCCWTRQVVAALLVKELGTRPAECLLERQVSSSCEGQTPGSARSSRGCGGHMVTI